MIEKMGVFNDVGAVLAQGLTGRFYVDRILNGAGGLRCQLFGIRSDRAVVLDSKDLRKRIAALRLIDGIAMLPVLGLGLIFLVQGIILMVHCERHDRRRSFYGGSVPPPLPAQAVRI